MSIAQARTGLVLTNPRSIYQSLISSGRITPDPAQARLSVQLQKLYYRLKDYEPEIEYKQRLEQLTRSIQHPSRSYFKPQSNSFSLWQATPATPSLSLTPTTPIYDSALSINSPQGMLLHGEVGRGKSMLLDLLANSLPSRKKRRWHFNSFMLEIFRRLERLRIDRAHSSLDYEHSVLVLARDTIASTPILFLDEFQLPDRAASKLLSSFFTAFFHLGGVMIATSNRMPEELANAAGLEFYSEPPGIFSSFRGMLGMRKTAIQKAANSDFGAFLEVLKARCEIWEMEGERDWRREDHELPSEEPDTAVMLAQPSNLLTSVASTPVSEDRETANASNALPHYFRTTSSSNSLPSDFPQPSAFTPNSLTIYSRPLIIPSQTQSGYMRWTFSQLCGTNLGPADYISLVSTYHTLILTAVPILTSTLKNEARRFITLLDELYESRCRLLILEAAAPIDQLFFPTAPSLTGQASTNTADAGDAITSESMSEIYQDRTSPFRPNISSYTSSSPPNHGTNYAPSSVLADEDADFGPTYGHGRSFSNPSTTSTTSPSPPGGPDFTNPTLLTGQDELFAFRRAESRLWEMCGAKWWDARPAGAGAGAGVAPSSSADEEEEKVREWHRPVEREARFWEGSTTTTITAAAAAEGKKKEEEGGEGSGGMTKTKEQEKAPQQQEQEQGQERRSLSRFRTHPHPPPTFGERHFWDLGLWGKRAGRWGQGVEGLHSREGERGRWGGGDEEGKGMDKGRGK